MKKKLSIILILAMLLSLCCACTNQEQSQPETSEETEATEDTGYTYGTVAPEDRTSETCRYMFPDGTYCGAPVTEHRSMCTEHFDAMFEMYEQYAETE